MDAAPQHVSAVIFDWDDTLSDTGVAWLEAHREKLRDHGIELETGAILSFFGNVDFAKDIGLEKFIIDGEPQSSGEVFEDVAERAKEKLKLVHVREHIIALLRELKGRGVKLAVVSSSPKQLLVESIKDNGLEDVFDVVISVEDVHDPKPDPEGILKALGRMHVSPGEAVMVGDSGNDVLAGKAAGTLTIRLITELHSHNPKVDYKTGSPDIIASDVAEAVRDLLRWKNT